MKHHMKGFFDLLVGDEVHEYKARGSAQGIAAGTLAEACGKSLSLTGTMMGGYSSTLFHLLYRFSPEIRTEFGRSDEHRWIQRYGFEEVSVGKPDDDALEDGRNSRRRSFRKVVREKPGLVPSALFHIIGNTIFLKLADVASGLPDYDEQNLVSGMDTEEDSTGYSQRSAYDTVFKELKAELTKGSESLARSGSWPPTSRRSSPTRTAAPGGRRSSTPGRATSSSPCRHCRRRSSTRRRRRWWTWWRRSGWRAAGCWSTSPTRGRGTSSGGWTTS